MPATEAISLWMRFPSLLLFCEDIGVSADAASEALLQLGMVLSALAAWSWYRSWVVFASLWLLYLSFVLVGQSFMSFQWDILLLEVGFLGAVSLTPPLQQHAGPAVIKLLFRFMFWKLMFMAGVVKLYANCPTWLNLTALEYHFATQPLPHGMSWYAHQMHPLLLRAGVAVTLLIEIPLTFFCVSQFQLVRQVGVIAQALLQIMIIFTGNYNFFNLLTLTLMIPVWSQDEVHLSPKGVVGGAYSWRYAGVLAFLVNIIAMMGALMFQATLLPIEARAGVVPQMFTHSALNRIKIDLSPNVAKYLPKCVSFSALVTIGKIHLGLMDRLLFIIFSAFRSCTRQRCCSHRPKCFILSQRLNA